MADPNPSIQHDRQFLIYRTFGLHRRRADRKGSTDIQLSVKTIVNMETITVTSSPAIVVFRRQTMKMSPEIGDYVGGESETRQSM